MRWWHPFPQRNYGPAGKTVHQCQTVREGQLSEVKRADFSFVWRALIQPWPLLFDNLSTFFIFLIFSLSVCFYKQPTSGDIYIYFFISRQSLPFDGQVYCTWSLSLVRYSFRPEPSESSLTQPLRSTSWSISRSSGLQLQNLSRLPNPARHLNLSTLQSPLTWMTAVPPIRSAFSFLQAASQHLQWSFFKKKKKKIKLPSSFQKILQGLAISLGVEARVFRVAPEVPYVAVCFASDVIFSPLLYSAASWIS